MIMMVIRNPVSGEEFAGSAQCEKTDKFALAKATSKAQRNALKSFIPEAICAQVVADVLAKKGARMINVTPTQPREPTVQPTLPAASQIIQPQTGTVVLAPQKRKGDMF